MKIIHLVPTYWPAVRYGGPIQSVHNLNKELVQQGVAVTVLTTNVDGSDDLEVPLGESIMIDGVRVFYFPTRWLRRWFFSPALFRYLNQIIDDYDLVHITSVFLSFSFVGAWVARRHRKPFIISPRGSLMRQTFASKFWKKKIYFSFFERSGLATASIVHLTSEAEKRDYLAANFPARRIAVIGNGLDPVIFSDISETDAAGWREKKGIKPDQTMIVCLGRLDWTKGFDDLIPAFAAVLRKKPQAVLVLIGDDERGYKKIIEAMIRKEGIEKNVFFVGPLQGLEKIVALKAADIFVSASYSESFGMAAAEAMAMSLPVILTTGVAVALIAAEAGAGLIVKKSPEKLTEAILQIINNKPQSLAMGQAGRQAALGNFSLTGIAKDFSKLYNSVINEK